MEELLSVKNPRVKEWRKLLTKKGRDQSGQYLVEGPHLIEEALKADEIIEVMVRQDLDSVELDRLEGLPLTMISAEISRVISATETPQGIFAVCRKRPSAADPDSHRRLLLLDRIQDPGNIGTMIRTADAAGIDAVIFGEGTGDLYNPKVIRSAQGSHFHLQIGSGSLTDWIENLKTKDIPVFGTAIQDAKPFQEVEPQDSFALIVGNEGAGVSAELLEKTEENLYVPLYGQSESLNVAIAAGILLYHLRKPI